MKKNKKTFKDIPRLYVLHNVNSNDKPIICKICGQNIKSISGFGTHTLNKHGITLDYYIAQYFKCLTPNFKFEKCGFCDRQARPKMKVDYVKQTYSLSYEDGYYCGTLECRDNISLTILGMHYDKALKQKKFEHIGANTTYLAKLYKQSEEYISHKIKYNENYVIPERSKTNLNGFIARYGKEEGTRRYNERCKKISKSLTVDWYIERYGIKEGTKRYQKRVAAFYAATADITHSKNQYIIYNALKINDDNWNDERYAGGIARVDMINNKLGVVIEYFGDFWHCNPAIYADTFYNKSLKMYAKDKQIFDKTRLSKILSFDKSISLIIVIWEKTFADMKYDVYKMLEKVYNIIKQHDKNKKEIIWI